MALSPKSHKSPPPPVIIHRAYQHPEAPISNSLKRKSKDAKNLKIPQIPDPKPSRAPSYLPCCQSRLVSIGSFLPLQETRAASPKPLAIGYSDPIAKSAPVIPQALEPHLIKKPPYNYTKPLGLL